MFKVTVFHGSQGQPHASMRAVEPVQHNGETLYRDVASGRVDRAYECLHERVFCDRDAATAYAIEQIRALSIAFAAECERAINELRNSEVLA
jgi:hypothetical protein